MTYISTFAQTCRAAVSALGRELADWRPSSERATFAVEAMVSVALSVALAHALHLPNTWWAATSGFAVAQTSLAGCVQRAGHRILGTVIGAALGTIVGPWIGDRPWLFVPVLGLISGVSVYRANGSNAAYAWLLGAVTALIVTYEAHGLVSARSTAAFAALRVAEVTVGTLSCVLVSAVSHFGRRWYQKAPPSLVSGSAHEDVESRPPPASIPAQSQESLNSRRTLLSLQGALAIAILAALTYALKLPGFAQAMVTTIAVLVLPATSPAGGTLRAVVERMVQRLVGCFLAGALGVALLPLTQGQAIPCMVALSIGVWSGSHVQTGKEGASYLGRQFTLAFIIVFVQDHHWSADPVPALMRLSGILTGIVVLVGVVLATGKLPLSSPPKVGGS